MLASCECEEGCRSVLLVAFLQSHKKPFTGSQDLEVAAHDLYRAVAVSTLPSKTAIAIDCQSSTNSTTASTSLTIQSVRCRYGPRAPMFLPDVSHEHFTLTTRPRCAFHIDTSVNTCRRQRYLITEYAPFESGLGSSFVALREDHDSASAWRLNSWCDYREPKSRQSAHRLHRLHHLRTVVFYVSVLSRSACTAICHTLTYLIREVGSLFCLSSRIYELFHGILHRSTEAFLVFVF